MTHQQTRQPNPKDEIRAIAETRPRVVPGWWVAAFGAVALAGAALLAQPAAAGSHGDAHAHGDHSQGDAHHAEGQAEEHADNPAVQAYREANDRMHEDMMVGFTGDADVDFARGMIPHHQGAIDMANIVLEHGDNEEIRQLAEEIIAAQEEEIAFLRAWLESHGHSVD